MGQMMFNASKAKPKVMTIQSLKTLKKPRNTNEPAVLAKSVRIYTHTSKVPGSSRGSNYWP